MVAGAWTLTAAAVRRGLRERPVRRLVRPSPTAGPAALAQGHRGRIPVPARPAGVRERVVALAREQDAGLGDQHRTEQLAAAAQLVLGREPVRRIRRGAGMPRPGNRRPPKQRSRRERMPPEGMLLQADGSRHRWLGEDGPYLTLVAGIDAATGPVPYALFREQEDAHG